MVGGERGGKQKYGTLREEEWRGGGGGGYTEGYRKAGRQSQRGVNKLTEKQTATGRGGRGLGEGSKQGDMILDT